MPCCSEQVSLSDAEPTVEVQTTQRLNRLSEEATRFASEEVGCRFAGIILRWVLWVGDVIVEPRIQKLSRRNQMPEHLFDGERRTTGG
jgi:hypothetical protein